MRWAEYHQMAAWHREQLLDRQNAAFASHESAPPAAPPAAPSGARWPTDQELSRARARQREEDDQLRAQHQKYMAEKDPEPLSIAGILQSLAARQKEKRGET